MHVFDMLTDADRQEARNAMVAIGKGKSSEFVEEIRSNPRKYPNLYQFKEGVLKVLHGGFAGLSTRKELIDPRFIGLPTDEEGMRQYEEDKLLEVASSNNEGGRMKVKLSRSSWEAVGEQAGWMRKEVMKTSQNTPQAEKYMQAVKNNLTKKFKSHSVDELKAKLPAFETNVKNYRAYYDKLIQENWSFEQFGNIQELFPTPESYLAVPTMIRNLALEILKGMENHN